jgi:hypothetical protein
LAVAAAGDGACGEAAARAGVAGKVGAVAVLIVGLRHAVTTAPEALAGGEVEPAGVRAGELTAVPAQRQARLSVEVLPVAVLPACDLAAAAEAGADRGGGVRALPAFLDHAGGVATVIIIISVVVALLARLQDAVAAHAVAAGGVEGAVGLVADQLSAGVVQRLAAAAVEVAPVALLAAVGLHHVVSAVTATVGEIVRTVGVAGQDAFKLVITQ